MASKMVNVLVLCFAVLEHAVAQSDMTSQGYSNAMAKFMQAGAMRPSSASSAIAAGAYSPINQPGVPTAVLKTIADLEDQNLEMAVAFQRLEARVEKLPQAPVKGSQHGFGFGVFGWIAYYAGLTVLSVTAARKHLGQGQRAGPIVASVARGGDVQMNANFKAPTAAGAAAAAALAFTLATTNPTPIQAVEPPAVVQQAGSALVADSDMTDAQRAFLEQRNKLKQTYDNDVESTFVDAAEFSDKKSIYVTIVGGLIVIAFVAPMIQFFYYTGGD